MVALIAFVFILMSFVFFFGFEEGYKQAIEDIRDVINAKTSNTSLMSI